MQDADTPVDHTLSPFTQSTRPREGSVAPWPDVWKVYEDVCIICAGLWMGPWRAGAGSERMENWGSMDGSSRAAGGSPTYTRNAGMGVGSRASTSSVTETGELRGRAAKANRRSSGSSLLWSWASARANSASDAPRSASPEHYKDADDGDEDAAALLQEARARQVATTLALLRVFHNNTTVLLSRFADIIPQRTSHSHNLASTGAGAAVVLTPKDLLSFDHGPLSGLDGHFVEWVAEEYGGGVRVVVRRGWRDIFALIFGIN